jgi:4-phytase / acid phosphatase
VVLIYRHGVRAPLADENGLGLALPAWTTPPSLLTPHGARALTLLARYQRRQLAGLLPKGRCPGPADLTIWTNTAARTIASGQALAEGFAPGCDLAVGHLAEGQHDPLFEQMEAGRDPFDPARAAADADAYTGGMPAMERRLAPALAAMGRIAGRDLPPGSVIAASGTAQILLLDYLEGMPVDVGPAAIAAVSPLHAALFEVLDRSPYLAPRVAGVLARRMVSALLDPGQARVTVLVGHDNNIAALGALLHTQFRLPGLGWNDPPPGGALGLELVRLGNGRRVVKAVYIAATPRQIRDLTVLDARHRPAELALPIGLCGQAVCSPAVLRARIWKETTL